MEVIHYTEMEYLKKRLLEDNTLRFTPFELAQIIAAESKEEVAQLIVDKLNDNK